MNDPAKVTMSDEAAEELLGIIRRFNGITTYPKYADDNHRVMHGGCLELERQGKICRRIECENSILWVIPGQPDEPVHIISIA